MNITAKLFFIAAPFLYSTAHAMQPNLNIGITPQTQQNINQTRNLIDQQITRSHNDAAIRSCYSTNQPIPTNLMPSHPGAAGAAYYHNVNLYNGQKK